MGLVFLCVLLEGCVASVACPAGTVDAKSGDSSSEPSIGTFNNKADHNQEGLEHNTTLSLPLQSLLFSPRP